MAEKMLKARIQHKHDFEANWKKAKNFIPLNGELIIYNAEVIRLKTYSVSFMTPTNLTEGSYEITSIEGLTVSTKDGDITFLSGITEKNLENAIALQISEMSEDKCKIILSIDYILPEDREEPIEFARFKIGNGTDFVNNLPFYAFAEEDEEGNLIYYAEDGSSLLIGHGEANRAGTKGFRIVKAQRETQDDGSYKYYYYLMDDSEIKKEIPIDWDSYSINVPNFDPRGVEWSIKNQEKVEQDVICEVSPIGNEDVVGTIEIYAFSDILGNKKIASITSNLEWEEGSESPVLTNITVYFEDTTELLTEFKETLAANPEATNTLRTYYINSTTGNLGREYADDYGKTYEATREGEYIKVRVEKVKKSYQPVPDSGKDPAGYEWQPTPESTNIYEIDYTDTWEHGQYSYFRLSVNPYLGTEWMETDGIVVGGSNSQALGKDSFTTGSDNIANGAHSAAFGDENYVNYAGIASGRKNKVLNKSGAAFGEKNIVRGYSSVAMGGSNEIGEENYTVAIGQYLKSHNSGEAIAGSYNIPLDKLDKKDDGTIKTVALSVGAGWSEDTRRDAMTVYKDGTTKVLGDVYSGSTNVTQTAKNAKSGADSATAAANAAKSSADEAKKIANQANTDITSLENAVEIMNDRLTADVDELYELSKNIKDDRTTLQLGELPEKGVVDKLYITDNSEQYIYKIRKTPKVDKDKVWKGTIQTSKPTGLKGSGTENDPYQITNGNELSYIVRNTKGYYSKLMNDIYLNDISNPNWKETANTWVNIASNRSFNGVFDGCNHTIYGLYYNQPTDAETANSFVGCALFPCINNLFSTTPIVIKNLGLDYVYVNSSSNAGALVGVTQSSNYEIKNCWIGENVELLGTYVASIHTWGNGKALIENCYSLATANVIEGVTRYPAFAQADWWNLDRTGESVSNTYPTFKNCYALNTRLNNKTDSTITVENCYCTVSGGKGTVIDKEDMTGINALEKMSLLDSNVVEPSDNIITLPYDNLPIGEEIRVDSEELLSDGRPASSMSVWTDESGIIYSSIRGTEANGENIDSYIKYKITTVEDYDPSVCSLKYDIISNDDLFYGYTIYMEGKDIYIQGQSNNNMPGFHVSFAIRVERHSSPVAYINDYTYPHLISFVEGWKCIDKDIEIPECEVTQEELDKQIAAAYEYSDKKTEEVENMLYQKTNTVIGAAKYIPNMIKNTECIIETGPDGYGYASGAIPPIINSKNLAIINTLITTSGYTENDITYTLLPDGGISIKGTAITTGSFDITNRLWIGWGPEALSNVMFSDSSDSALLEVVELEHDGSEKNYGETEILTKLGVLISPYGGYDRKIKFSYIEGTEYNSTVYPQVEIDTLVPTSFVPAKRFEFSVIEEQVDEENTLIKGKYKFVVPETGGYVIRTPGLMSIGDVFYSVLGDYGTSILSETQSQIDKQIGDINSILATLVEGSAE